MWKSDKHCVWAASSTEVQLDGGAIILFEMDGRREEDWKSRH